MKTRALRKPDGSLEVDGERYRLREPEQDSFEVLRVRDGAPMGRFHLDKGAAVVVDAGSEPAIVEAIAHLLGQPRGALPLQ